MILLQRSPFEGVTPGTIIILLIGIFGIALFMRWMYKQK